MAEPRPKTDEELRALLGDEDFELLKDVKSKKDAKERLSTAKENATKMISEGGKYYERYHPIEEQLNAVWNKAYNEAKKDAGVVEKD